MLGPDGQPLPSEQPPPPPPPPSALDLAREGRALLKAKELDKAVAKMKEAVELGDKDGLPDEERGLLLYQYALALERNGQSAEAISVLRKAAQLAPKDADIRLELAQRLLDDDQHADAKKEAETAQRLGLEDADDKKEAERIIKKAKLELLHDRFTFYGGVSFAYDSNVLQGASRETIAGQNTGGSFNQRSIAKAQLSDRRDAFNLARDLSAVQTYKSTIEPLFLQAIASPQEVDLPLNLHFDLGGRLVGNSAAQLWLNYRFAQSIMFSPQRTPAQYADGTVQVATDGSTLYDKDHDSYSSQDHTASLSFFWTPVRWLVLRPRVDGFVNFTGLRQFEPFQGGMYAVLDTSFIESRLFRTRLVYQHQLRRSFDRNSSELDGDRDDVKLTQELRVRGASVSVRGTLGYRFRSDRSGALTSALPYSPELLFQYGPRDPNATFPLRESLPFIASVDLGEFTYKSSLTYLAHELSTRWRLSLPHAIEILIGFGYEYRSYQAPYQASYAGLPIDPNRPAEEQPALPPKPNAAIDSSWGVWVCNTRDNTKRCIGTLPSLSDSTFYSTRRTDHLISADLSLSKDLPHGFGLELSYSLLKNFSSIANAADNRNYIKHLVQLSLSYSF